MCPILSDSHFAELMTALTTPIFDFVEIVSVHSTQSSMSALKKGLLC